MKTAILQVADTSPLESLVVMLRSVGYECFLPDDRLKAELRGVGCDTVLDVRALVENWGYQKPLFDLPLAGPSMLSTCDLYVDVKAHRNGPKIWNRRPHLRNKTLWYRINGGEPEHVVRGKEDCGDEVDPPCPVLTPNMWYQDQYVARVKDGELVGERFPWANKSYVMWPPFVRFDEYTRHTRSHGLYQSPICLIHHLAGWGYGDLINRIREMGVRCHGRGSPDGLIQNNVVARELSSASAMVHLKSSDAPGYALYEGLAAGCPLVVSRRLIWRNRMQDLLIPGETCLVFDKETHDSLQPEDVALCAAEIEQALFQLRDPDENQRIGFNGRAKLQSLTWSEKNPEDVESLRQFMQRMFP